MILVGNVLVDLHLVLGGLHCFKVSLSYLDKLNKYFASSEPSGKHSPVAWSCPQKWHFNSCDDRNFEGAERRSLGGLKASEARHLPH
ncbi:hypothetical protein A2U01_0023107, partial [Trifolium medium]|nr:hypothetical protein [Trifolium medium]